MWSVGCILGELLKRRPILPGQDSNLYYPLSNNLAKNQLKLIFDLIGTPTNDEIAQIPAEKSRKFVANI